MKPAPTQHSARVHARDLSPGRALLLGDSEMLKGEATPRQLFIRDTSGETSTRLLFLLQIFLKLLLPPVVAPFPNWRTKGLPLQLKNRDHALGD